MDVRWKGLKQSALIPQNTEINQVEEKESALFMDFTQRKMVVQKTLYGTAILHCVKSQKSSDAIYTTAGP